MNKEIKDTNQEECYEVTVESLVFKDKDYYSAVTVSMDIWGYGDTPEEAFEEMHGNVIAQISFAIYKNDMSLLESPSEQKYFDMLSLAKWECLNKAVNKTNKDHITAVPRAFPIYTSDMEATAFA